MAGTIYTVGHSTLEADSFRNLLVNAGIKLLADVRRFPGSKRYPWFGSEALKSDLSKAEIEYRHLENLGGRRPPRPDSPHTAWRNSSFRGYADYMDTDEFKKALKNLEELAAKQTTAMMCSEAVWWRCHRSLVSDALKDRGWTVLHLFPDGKQQEHPYTAPARQKKLF